MPEAPDKLSSGLGILLQIESMARNAESLKALEFLIVNETRKLVPYGQAFLVSINTRDNYNIESASSVAVIDRDAPSIRWLIRLLKKLGGQGPMDSVQQLDASNCPEGLEDEWQDYAMPFALWCPLKLVNGKLLGGLWLGRDTPWQENEITILRRLSETYGHAIGALTGGTLGKPRRSRGLMTLVILFVLVLISLIPVPLSVLAPVEIVARDPVIVSAPVDGVIKEIFSEPNTEVREGDKLFSFDDTTLRNQFEIAERNLAVHISEFRKASQSAFGDPESKARLALLKSQVELSEAEVDYARELLERVLVVARQGGLLLYSDKDDWVGRPVSTGERIMEIAEPDIIEARVWLSVDDAIILSEDATVDIFLDVDPLNSIPAAITHRSYRAELTPDNILAFRITANFTETSPALRIGLRGTAKLYGDRVSLFFYLFRRPISSLRQMIGL